jgi:hypothetical protein
MGFASERVFKLSNYPGSLGLSCDEDGLELAGVPLLNKTNQGFIARPANEIEHLIASAYGADTFSDLTMTRLEAVARALNAGELAYAMTAAVLLKFPELDWNGAARLAQADDLLKYDPDEPRDWHGRNRFQYYRGLENDASFWTLSKEERCLFADNRRRIDGWSSGDRPCRRGRCLGYQSVKAGAQGYVGAWKPGIGGIFVCGSSGCGRA